MLAGGGLPAMAARSAKSTGLLYDWAEASDFATPFVPAHEHRSPVVATIDLDARIDGEKLQKVLRANGVVDVFPYRKLGRNQLRVGCFPAVEPTDVERLIASIDWVVAHW
jgi:phosphoserine aminotransferase